MAKLPYGVPEIELEPQFETGVTGAGDLRYNIQMARRSDGVWYQRHIWHRAFGKEIAPPRAEHWIRGTQNGPGAHMSQVAA
jgi:hypothetical protein